MKLSLVKIESVETKKFKLRVIHIIMFFIVLCFALMIIFGKIKRTNTKKFETAVLSATEEQLETNTEESINEEIIAEEPVLELEPEPVIEKNKLPELTDNAKEKMKHIYSSDEKVAYLTFDDGPSKTVTPFILDLLKQNDIKVTFFTLGSNVELYPELVKREYDEGHYVANHGYSHVYKKIYASVQNVLDEFNRTETAIQNALENPEYHSHLIRFPGGSRGNKYQGLIEEAIRALEENNVTYVDWNCLTGDSAGNKDKESLMQEFLNTSERKKQFSYFNA